MAQAKTSQAQQMSNDWQSMMDQQVERINAFYTDLGEVESKSAEQASKNIDEMARLTKASLDYALQLSAEWRRVSLEATRRNMELMANPWKAMTQFNQF